MIAYISGDLFSHRATGPFESVYAHACNCQGSWGAGVAAAFRKRFPAAYREYSDHCGKNESLRLLGTCLVIPALLNDQRVYIACLFTSDFAGKRKMAPAEIVKWTDLAMGDLLSQLGQLKANGCKIEEAGGRIAVSMPKINAGLFAVPWEETEAVLKKCDAQINVYVIE